MPSLAPAPGLLFAPPQASTSRLGRPLGSTGGWRMDDTAWVGIAVVYVLVLAIGLVGLVVWVLALVECARFPDYVYRAAGTEKLTWMLVVGLAGWIGAIVYAFTVRSKLREVAAQGTAALGAYPEYAATPPGWYRDPQDGGRMRYWDGRSWTEHVT